MLRDVTLSIFAYIKVVRNYTKLDFHVGSLFLCLVSRRFIRHRDKIRHAYTILMKYLFFYLVSNNIMFKLI